jgi:hypothetical protein
MQASEEETLDGVVGRYERKKKKSLVMYHLTFIICYLGALPGTLPTDANDN